MKHKQTCTILKRHGIAYKIKNFTNKTEYRIIQTKPRKRSKLYAYLNKIESKINSVNIIITKQSQQI